MAPEAVTETNVVADIVIFAEYTDGYGSKFTVPYSLATFPDTDEYSLQQVLVHELGHAAGFRHSEDEDSVMYAEAQLGWVGAILPSDDDGLSFIYN